MFVIKIRACGRWGATFVIPKPTEQEAKQTAFEAARKTFSCTIPDTLEEFEADDSRYYMEVLADDAEFLT